MRAHIVLAHPEPESFNAHLAARSKQMLVDSGNEVSLADLYALDFDARESPTHYPRRKDPQVFHAQSEQRHAAEAGALPGEVEAEIQNLLACDLLIVHFPLWWFGAPAILKGWMDRVFVYGRMYRSEVRYDRGICRGKRALLCVTTGASRESCSHNGREGDTQLHLWPVLFPFRYLGFEVLQPAVFHGVGGVAFLEAREDGESLLDVYAQQWEAVLRSIGERPPVRFNRDEDFDEAKQLKTGAPVYSPFVRHNRDLKWD